ncbi:GTPase-associated system all-helical protein GASH [Brucella intermedia]|uniref:GTPase-associated system all-helical protein GASH n=1 Tax=Brucella intermedia TaxID=94625 RepID=UPI0034CDAA3E
MNDIAIHMRITGLHVSNDDVDSRTAAANALKTAWAKVNALDGIVTKAEEVAASLAGDGMPPAGLGNEVQAAIQKKASAFLYLERPLDIGIVAGNAAASFIADKPGTNGWTIADVWAATLWAALSFQHPLEDPKRETLRTYVLDTARTRCMLAAEAARERVAVGDFKKLEIASGQEEKFAETFEKSTFSTIDALRRNAALDREELDFLWWSLTGRSRLLGKQFSQIDGRVGGIAAGIEAAAHLRRLPCEVHRDLVLGKVAGGPAVDLVELIEEVGEQRERLAHSYASGFVARYSTVFPLLHALSTGKTEFNGAETKRSAEEWASRALLEAGFEKILRNGPAKL